MPDAGPHRGPGPQTGPLALFAPPARLALATDSALGPQRSGQAHCARLVAPSRSRPEDRSPARRVDALQQSVTLCPPGSSRPGDRPRLGDLTLSQRSSTLCRLGSAQQVPAGGPPPARRVDALQAIRHTVPAWQRPADPA